MTNFNSLMLYLWLKSYINNWEVKTRPYLLTAILSTCFFLSAFGQDNAVAIGSNTTNPDAVLMLVSPDRDQGFLVPQMTTAERGAANFGSDAANRGMLVFDTTVGSFFYWNNGQWNEIGQGTSISLIGGQGITVNGTTIEITNNSITTAMIEDGTISNVDIANNANIALSKLDNSGGSEGQVVKIVGGQLTFANDEVGSGTTPTLSDGQLIVGDGNSNSAGNVGGDVSLSGSNFSVNALRGQIVSNTIPTDGQVLQFTGGQWHPATVSGADNQQLSLNSTTNLLSLTNSGDVDLSEFEQSLSISGNLINISGGTGTNLSSNAPSTDQVLKWDGSAWTAQGDDTGSGSLPTLGNAQIITNDGTTNIPVTVGGDLSMDNSGSFNITSLQGNLVSAGSPAAGQVLKWSGTQWEAATDDTGSGTLPVLTDAQLITNDGTNDIAVTVGGDATFANDGTLTISNDAVTPGKIAGAGAGSRAILGSGSSNNVSWVVGTPNQLLSTDGVGDIMFIDKSSMVDITGLSDGIVPRASSGAFVSGRLFDNGTNVGVGTTSPNQVLHVLSASNQSQIRLDDGVDFWELHGGTDFAIRNNTAAEQFVIFSTGEARYNGNFGINVTPTIGLEINTTDAIGLPVGTSAQRPGSPAAGMFRFNSESSAFEGYDGSNWSIVGGSSGNAWSLQGNAGTDPVNDFMGTTDDTPFELRVNSTRVGRLELDTSPFTSGTLVPNVLLGYSGNTIASGAKGAAVLGGGDTNANSADGDWAVVAGGRDNHAGSLSPYAAYASIGGGASNQALAQWATIPGGKNVTANGNGSFATGIRTISESFSSIVVGSANEDPSSLGYSNNTWVETDPIFIVGNGEVAGNGSVVDRSNAMTILKNGNVGIGTTPNTRLEVGGSGDITSRVSTLTGDVALELFRTGNSNIDYRLFSDSDDDFLKIQYSNNDMSSVTDALTISDAGNVGIGVSPNWRLNVGWDASNNINPVAELTNTGTNSSSSLRFTNGATNHYNIGITQGDNFAISAQNSNISLSSDLFTIASDGSVGIGVTSPSRILHVSAPTSTAGLVRISSQSLNTAGLEFAEGSSGDWRISTATLSSALEFYSSTDDFSSTSLRYTFTTAALLSSGNLNLGSSGLRWNTIFLQNSPDVSSDRRLKHSIHDLNYGLNTVMQLRPVSYILNQDKDENVKLGLVAQEVQSVIPEVVGVGDDDQQLLSIRYTELIAVLTKAVQEQQALIEKQNKEIERLKSEFTQFKKDQESKTPASSELSSLKAELEEIKRLIGLEAKAATKK
ncbi:MAG: tail fiber domain-containing protein [Bacteroidota bacterium]